MFRRLFGRIDAKSRPDRNEGKQRVRAFVADFERLEQRLVPYATTGGVWPHPELVTVGFMPDGTDVGGLPSALFGTLDARWPTATWQKEILRAAQSYAANANLNFSLVPDDGAPLGSAGLTGTDNNKQGDSNFGDIRIGAALLAPNLGLALLPPDINQDTSAGDFLLDTTTSWNINGSVDLFTVSAHEAGHSLGLGHSDLSTAVMYSTYNGVKSSLTADDIAGIQAIYGARPQDSFDATDPNNTKGNSTVITSYIDGNKQITLTNLDVTSTSDIDWYKFTIPSGHAGTMTVQVQSTGLSLFAPKLTLFKGSTNKGTVIGEYHSTVSQTETISSGQNWFIKVEGADSTVFGTGGYAVQVNMGTVPLPPVTSPNTATPATGGGGSGSPEGDAGHSHGGDASGAAPTGGDATHDAADSADSSTIVATASASDGDTLSLTAAPQSASEGGNESNAAGSLVGSLSTAGDATAAATGADQTASSEGRSSSVATDHLLEAHLLDDLLLGDAIASDWAGRV